MRRIPLSQGKEALVDDCDYDFLMQRQWHVYQNGRLNYARAWGERKQTTTDMHRAIAARMGFQPEAHVDHKDGHTLNNCRYNLRPATRTENLRNRGPTCRNTSDYKGVSRKRNRWLAKIQVDGKAVFLGTFEDKRDAAKAYNEAASKYFGEFAWLNLIEE